MDTRNITFEENYVIIRIGNLFKTTNKKHHTGNVKVSHFPSTKGICSVYCLNKISWCNKTDEKRYYFTVYNHIKPYKPILKDTVTWWIKTTLVAAGIDVKLFTPHSARSASNSKVKLHVPIETIQKTRGLRSMHKFAKHYVKLISKENEFANSILNYEN